MNPFLEAERARKRDALLAATEADLEKITAACARARRPLPGQDNIALRAGKVLNRRKVAKHFTIDIGEDHFSYHRNQDSITAEANLDGIYVLRTSVADGDLDSPEVVSSYKALAQVERAFRAFNTDLDIHPIFNFGGCWPGHRVGSALCRNHEVSRWRRADRSGTCPAGAGTAGRGRADGGGSQRPGGGEAVPGVADVREPLAAEAGRGRPGGAGVEGCGLCGQRRLASRVTGGDRLGGAAAGHIMITARRAS